MFIMRTMVGDRLNQINMPRLDAYEQSYKQMKDELGWADFMVRSDRAIRRHWILVFCAFAFCWWHDASQVSVSGSSAPPEVREKNDAPVGSGAPCWPRALRAVRAWLAPAHWLTRCWSACSDQPPPAELATLLHALASGQGINLYLRI